MALTSSKPFSASFPLPDFALPDVTTDQRITPTFFSDSRALVVIFLCRHCPYVVHLLAQVVQVAHQYQPKNISFVGISSNDAALYPEDSPAQLKTMVEQYGIPFPILYDKSQETAQAFQAVCTPEFFVFDQDQTLFYHGRFDGSRPGNNIPCSGSDLRDALEARLADRLPPSPQQPSVGCNIKWT